MNRISPFNESDFNSSLASATQPSNIVMTNKNNQPTTFIDNSQSVERDLNPISHEVVITMNVVKDESTSDNHNKNDTSNQITALVKFIKNSFSTNKKKSDSVVSPKMTCLQKFSISQQSNQIDIAHSEQSNCNVNLSVTSSNDIFCRFCQEFEPENELVTPCLCSGTLKYIHQSCLQRWIKVQDNRFCELCKYGFRMKITSKPLREWKKLEMTVMERRKIICSVTFHIIALTCVIWSLYVLIERTTEEIHNGIMEWPLWTKLIVVAIGFIGGVVFMYVQCRMYVSLCRKWHIFNRTFVVQNISPMELLIAQKEAKIKCENYQKNVQFDRAQIFGDVMPTVDTSTTTTTTTPTTTTATTIANVNLTHAPVLSSSDEDFNLSSPSDTIDMPNYRGKMFSDDEDSYVRDNTTRHGDLNDTGRPANNNNNNTLVAHRTVDS